MNITDALLTDISLFGDMAVASNGDLQTVSGLANVQQALLHRLMTVPGSLVHKPTYGIGIGRFQNAPTSLQTQQNIAQLIGEQFPLDPRVQSVSAVSISSADGTPELTVISVAITIVGYTEQIMSFTPFEVGTV